MLSPRIKFKKKWSNKGVSEIIGTILILAITVALFSSIILMVYNMPVPNEIVNADFVGELNFIDDTSAYLNLTHNGGERLYDYRTLIIIRTAIGSSSLCHLTDDSRFESDTAWQIGMEWSNITTGITTSTKVDVSIVDIEANAAIWTGTVSGGLGSFAPVIAQQWADFDTTTATPDPIAESSTQGYTLFVRATDPDDTLNASSVYVDASALPSGDSQMSGTMSNNLWRFAFNNIPLGDAKYYDGKPLIIHAVDDDGNEDVVTYQLDVEQPDVTTYENRTYPTVDPNVIDLGEGGLPDWMLFQGAGQGYVILGENTSDGARENGWGFVANVADPKTTFTQGEEWIFIRVGSTTLSNLLGRNDLSFVNRFSGETVVPPSNSTAFYRLSYSGNAFIYEAKFNSSVLAPGAYDVAMRLQSSLSDGGTPEMLSIDANLTIFPPSGQETFFIPEIKLYKSSDRNPSDEWGTVDNPFDLSNYSASVVWVELNLQDAGAASSLSIDEVRIRDFQGRSNLYGSPPTSSDLMGDKQSDSISAYYFSIDLRLKNGENWLAGRQAYSLILSNLFDENEGVYTISLTFWVQSPVGMQNYIVSTNGLGIGHANFAHFEYMFQIDNNRFFTARILEERDESPGGGGGSSMDVYDIIYFDMDGDGDRDVLAAIYDGMATTHYLGIYINRLNEYGIWERRSNFDGYTDGDGILSMTYGDVDGDGDYDWVVAGESTANNLGGNVYLYTNDFPITQTLLFDDSKDHGFVEMRLADITGDGKDDLIVIDCGDNVNYDETTTYRGTVGAELKIYNITTGTPYPITSVPTNDEIYDFDVADMDDDDDADIAIISANSAYGVSWYERTETLSTAITDSEYTAAGTIAENSHAATQSDGGAIEAIEESAGDLGHIWNITDVSGIKPNVYIDAYVSSGSNDGFYFYYTTNFNGPWTFMFTMVSSVTEETSYSFPLPLGTSGNLFIRVNDSLSGSDSSDDTIYVDLINVKGIEQISFSDHVLTTDDTSYVAIGIGNFNNDGNMDIAIGMSGAIKVINGSDGGKIADSADGDFENVTDLNPDGDTFEVGDVNGDSLADIVSVLDYNGDRLIIQEWINLGLGGSYQDIEVKNLSMLVAGDAGPTYAGDIQHLSVENPYG